MLVDDVVPETIGHYRILRKIGEGGMGEVFLAEDIQLDRRVALKLLPPGFGSDSERLRRFQKEARAASGLNHPNILTIFEVGFEEPFHYIVTEFIDGETLRDGIERKSMTLDEVIDAGIAVASALVASHEIGVVHRDIKPENVMIRRDGVVKVLDFGLAKLTDDNRDNRRSPSTDPGKVMGTPQYMSPEQLRGNPVDPRTDIFSLGVLLYEMISGRAPFDGSTSDIIAGILERRPEPLARFSREVVPELERIVTKALQKNVNERYQSAKDFLLDLKSLKQEREFAVRRSSGEYARDEFVRSRTLTSPGFEMPEGPSFALWKNKKLMAVAMAIAVAIIAALAILTPDSHPIDSIAVLPFENVGGNVEREYLTDGVTESIIHNLSQLPRLHVMARSTVFRYKGSGNDPQNVGKALNVSAVLTGRIAQRGQRILIESELVDVDDGRQIWGAQYNRPLADLIVLQQDISREISNNLRMQLSGEEQRRVAKNYTDNHEAYEAYLKGRYYWNKRNSDGVAKAIDFFQEAIDLDPTYALAYSGLADSYLLSPLYAGTSASEAFPRAKAAALKALEIDSELAEAYTSLAHVRFTWDWDWAGAESAFQRAIDVNPNYSTAHQWYALYLSAMGRHAEALKEIRRAEQVDPLSLIISTSVGTVHYLGGRYDDALAQFQRTLELEPAFIRTRFEMARCFELKGNVPAALKELEALPPAEPVVLAARARAYALAGDREQSNRLLDELLSRDSGHVNAYDVAAIYVAAGDHDKAFIWLDKAYGQHVPRLSYFNVEPMFIPLRRDPRFARLSARIGLTQPSN